LGVITTEQLELHAKWLRGDDDGQRLDLRRANLSGADLRRADLRSANLRNANLSSANLSSADLRSANLRNANLRNADLRNADLRNADLRSANLRNANLSSANLSSANLSSADLRNADLRNADLSDAEGLIIASDAADRLKAVAANALATDAALEMETWHACNTTHCIAGWAIHLAGEPGRLLEELHGPAIAGLMLLGAEAHSHFYDSNEDARKWLQEVLER